MGVRAVKFFGGLSFARDIGDFRDGGLHAVSHFILGDAGLDLGVEFVLEIEFIEGGEFIEQRRPDWQMPSGLVR